MSGARSKPTLRYAAVQLTDHFASDHRNAVIELLEALMHSPRHQRVVPRFAGSQLTQAQHAFDELIGAAQVRTVG